MRQLTLLQDDSAGVVHHQLEALKKYALINPSKLSEIGMSGSINRDCALIFR